jgi:hypothetical protein
MFKVQVTHVKSGTVEDDAGGSFDSVIDAAFAAGRHVGTESTHYSDTGWWKESVYRIDVIDADTKEVVCTETYTA